MYIHYASARPLNMSFGRDAHGKQEAKQEAMGDNRIPKEAMGGNMGGNMNFQEATEKRTGGNMKRRSEFPGGHGKTHGKQHETKQYWRHWGAKLISGRPRTSAQEATLNKIRRPLGAHGCEDDS